MKQITRYFLNSDMNEADFYNLPKDNLITLREYLLDMLNKDNEFLNLIGEPLSSMKEKCPWINDIGYDMLQLAVTGSTIDSTIWLFPTDGHNMIVSKNKNSSIYDDLAKVIPSIYLLDKNVKKRIKRQNELLFIQDELHEIDKIGRNFYDELLYDKTSISGDFDISYVPNIGMYVYTDNEFLAACLVRNMKSYQKPYLKDKQKDKVLARIQLEK